MRLSLALIACIVAFGTARAQTASQPLITEAFGVKLGQRGQALEAIGYERVEHTTPYWVSSREPFFDIVFALPVSSAPKIGRIQARKEYADAHVANLQFCQSDFDNVVAEIRKKYPTLKSRKDPNAEMYREMYQGHTEIVFYEHWSEYDYYWPTSRSITVSCDTGIKPDWTTEDPTPALTVEYAVSEAEKSALMAEGEAIDAQKARENLKAVRF